MRLASIVDRSYTEDLSYLLAFREGAQSQDIAPIAESLLAAGLVTISGSDGGGPEGNGGAIYALNHSGELLVVLPSET